MPPPNLLVLSDIHLGSTLVEHVQPARQASAGGSTVDQALVGFLDWYREHPRDQLPWRLVIAGDFVDFTGMSLSPHATSIQTGPTSEELRHGLGSAVDHTLCKLHRVFQCHESVFGALAHFVSAGNQLVIVHGNHDVEFHWRPVREEFIRILSQLAPLDPGSILFQRWFYYEPERVYIEHGHQYDPYCAQDHVLHPVSPRDPRRCARSLSDIFVRCVVRPTRGLTESGHDQATAFDYVRFGLSLGLGGLAALARRFLRAIGQLNEAYRSHFSHAARSVAAEHERRLQRLTQKTRLELSLLAALQALPITRSWLAILSSVMLDRVLTGCLALALTFGCWSLAASWQQALACNLAALAPVLAVSALWVASRRAIDPRKELRERAQHIARLAPAAFVVMGHTHVPERHTAGPSTTYVNLGAWAEEAGAEEGTGFSPPLPATRTHLVVMHSGAQTTAELLQWEQDVGPRSYRE